MPINTAEMRQNRHKLLEDCRNLLNKSDEEKRNLTAEERKSYDAMYADSEKMRLDIEQAEQRNDIEKKLAHDAMMQHQDEKPAAKEEKRIGQHAWDTTDYRTAFNRYLTTGRRGLTSDEERALQAGSGTAGGYLYAPEVFVNELIQNVTDATIFRGLARVLPPIMGADSLGSPVLTNRMAASSWTSEIQTTSGTADSTLAFGKRELRPHPLAKEIVVSKVLLRKVANAENIVRGELSRVVAEAMENAYMTGTGDQQPLGIFTASNSGISTSRDVSTGNAATAVTFDGLKAAKYELKQAYWGGAAWIMHRDLMEQISKLKDGDGRYILQDSVVNGDPDRLLGFPVNLSEFAPSTMTTLQYVAALGNFRECYWIVDSMDVEIVRAEELLVRTNQDLFVVRMASDGAPVKEEAMVRVKLA